MSPADGKGALPGLFSCPVFLFHGGIHISLSVLKKGRCVAEVFCRVREMSVSNVPDQGWPCRGVRC